MTIQFSNFIFSPHKKNTLQIKFTIYSKEELSLYHRCFTYNHGNRCSIGNEGCWFDRIQSTRYQFGCIDHCRHHCIEENLFKRPSWWDHIPCCRWWSSPYRILSPKSTTWCPRRTTRYTNRSIPLLLRLSNPTIPINGHLNEKNFHFVGCARKCNGQAATNSVGWTNCIICVGHRPKISKNQKHGKRFNSKKLVFSLD